MNSQARWIQRLTSFLVLQATSGRRYIHLMPSFKTFRALKVFKTTGLFLASRDPAPHQEVLFLLFLPGLETLHIFVFLATGVFLKLL